MLFKLILSAILLLHRHFFSFSEIYFLIPAVIAQILNAVASLVIRNTNQTSKMKYIQ